MNAGIGIALWRRPGDVVARFTSTVQRVKFEVEALTREHVRVNVAGFALWSVSPGGERPFEAFRKLGMANLDAAPADLKSSRHLLTTAQYKAFQALLAAEVQGHATTLGLREILSDQQAFGAGLAGRLGLFARGMGIEMDRVEILHARPGDPSILGDLSARHEQEVREEATRVRVESAERLKQQEIASAARLAQEEAKGRLERETAAEAGALALLQARLEREETELAARLDRTRREAILRSETVALANAAEEQKSQAVRDHELAKLVSEKIAEALKALPLRDARWVSFGGESPIASLAGMIAGARELLAPPSERAPM